MNRQGFNKRFIAIGAMVAIFVATAIFLSSQTTDDSNDVVEAPEIPIQAAKLDEQIGVEPAKTPSVASSNAKTERVIDRRTEEDWIREVVAELIRAGDSSSLMSAALLMRGYEAVFRGNESQQAFEQKIAALLASAAMKSPQEPLAQWLARVHCESAITLGARCELDSLDEALRAADPDNAPNWLNALSAAASLQERDEIKRILARMGSGKRFEDYRPAVVSYVARSLESVRIPPPSDLSFGADRPIDRLVDTATRAIPHGTTASLYKVCNPLTAGELNEPCRRVAMLMIASNDPAMAQTGAGLAKSMASFDSPEMERLRAMHRKSLWQMEQAVRAAHSTGQGSEFIDKLRNAPEREKFLRANDVPLDPPQGWEPSTVAP